MEDIKHIIAKNISELRTNAKMTQLELAERLNYSDKAVSKWERGESAPEISTLIAIAKTFSVSLDYLVSEEHAKGELGTVCKKKKPQKRATHMTVTAICILSVWLASIAVCIAEISGMFDFSHILVMLYATLTTVVLLLIFNSIWFEKKRNYAIISAILWVALTAVQVTLHYFGIVFFYIYLLGLPIQAGVVCWYTFRKMK